MSVASHNAASRAHAAHADRSGATVPISPAEVAALRMQFPYFNQPATHDHPPVTYLDAAATSQRPLAVLDAERSFLSHENAAVRRGTSSAVAGATDRFESARASVANFVGAQTSEQIVWTAGATDALNLVAIGFGEASAGLGGGLSRRFALGTGDEILVTEAEHHANLIPWQRLAQKTGAQLKYIPVRECGIWSLDDARAAINTRTRIFAFSHVSNVTGFVAPVAELVELAHEVGAITVLDACQSVPHMPVSFEQLGVDFAAFSSHKTLGPTGLGVLYGRIDLLETLPPARTGGSAITKVTMTEAEFLPPPFRFEAGTQPVSQAIGLAAAVTWLTKIGMHRAATRERELVARLVEGLLAEPGVRMLGAPNMTDRVALAAVAVDGVHAHDIGQYLDQRGVIVRVGHHCAQPLHRAMGVSASTRASVHITSTEDEIDRFLAALHDAKRYFGAER